MITPEEVSKLLPPPSSAAPLLVHFPAGCAQNGVFCALVVFLISKCLWKFACNVKGNPLCVSRSCVRFQFPGKPASIVLVDSFSYFEVQVTMIVDLALIKQYSVWLGVKLPIADTGEGKDCLSAIRCWMFCVLCLQWNFYCRLVIGFPHPGDDGDNETAPPKKHPLPVSKGTSVTIAQCSVLSAHKAAHCLAWCETFNKHSPSVVHQFMFSDRCVFITTFIVLYIIAAFFPFCAPGCEIVAPRPKRQRCDTASELENHYYSVIF